MSSMKDRLYAALAPYAYDDANQDNALETFVGAQDALSQEIEDYASDGPNGEAGWSSIVDLNRAPTKGLPWLGQFIGATVDTSLSDVDQRQQIRDTGGWKRGSTGAIIGAAVPYLTGGKTVILRERDPVACPSKPEQGLTVITYRDETPVDFFGDPVGLTLSGNEITDAVRSGALSGDGLAAGSGMGIWEGTTNLLLNGGFTVDNSNWTTSGCTIARDSTRAKFGTTSGLLTATRAGDVYVSPGGDIGGLRNGMVAGNTYTFSVWVYIPSTGDTGWHLMFYDRIYSGGYASTQSANMTPGQWNFVQITRTVRSGATDAFLRIESYSTTNGAQIWIDGAQLELRRSASSVTLSGNEITDATRLAALSWGAARNTGQTDDKGWAYVNWVTNPSFKTGIANWSFGGAAGSTFTWSSTGGTGQNTGCLQMSGTGAATSNYLAAIGVTSRTLANYQNQAMPVVAGQTLRMRASMQLSALSGGTVPDLTAKIEFYDSTQTLIGTSNVAQQQLNPTVGTWYNLSGTVVAPANAVYAVARCSSGESVGPTVGATWTVLVDQVQLLDNTQDGAAAYLDGDTNFGPGSLVQWHGTAESAPSRIFWGDGTVVADRAATNIFKRGQCDAVGASPDAWVNGGSGGAMSVVVDATQAAPFSPQSMKVTVDGANNNQGVYASAGCSVAAGQTIIGSIWFKGVSGKVYKAVMNYFNGTTEKTGAALTFTATGAWQLLQPSGTVVAVGDTATTARLYVQTTTAVADTYWVAHAMIEAGVVDWAPYVPTTGGASSTQAASNITAPSSLLNQSQAWVACRFQYNGAASIGQDLFVWLSGTQSIYIQVNAANQVSLNYTDGTFNLVLPNPAVLTAGQLVTVVAYWAPTGIGISVNGSTFTTGGPKSTSPTTLPATFNIATWSGTHNTDGRMFWFMGGTGTIVNADAATLSSIGNTDPNVDATLGATAAATFVWTAQDATYQQPGSIYLGATPYVDTSGTTAARAASRVTGLSSHLDPTQGWIAIRFNAPYIAKGLQFPRLFSWSDGTSNNYFDLGAGVSTSTGLPYVFWHQNVGGVGVELDVFSAFTLGQDVTVVAYWTATTLGLSVNGSAFITRTRTAGMSFGSATTFDIGRSSTSANSYLDGNVRWFMTGKGTLTSTDAATLNSLGNTLPKTTTLPNSSAPEAIMPMVNNSFSSFQGTASIIYNAILPQKPAGIILRYEVLEGQDFQDVYNDGTFQDVYNTYQTFEGVLDNVPGT